jgi:hypothetical protein
MDEGEREKRMVEIEVISNGYARGVLVLQGHSLTDDGNL